MAKKRVKTRQKSEKRWAPQPTAREQHRLGVITDVVSKKLSMSQAAESLELSTRQIRRVVRRVKTEGDQGIVHKLRGRESNRKYPDEIKQRIVKLYAAEFSNQGPTSARERICKRIRIQVNRETLRRWLIEARLWHKRRNTQKGGGFPVRTSLFCEYTHQKRA